jgi:hypothetical protein
MALVCYGLAESGFEVFAVDLPGHGESRAGFDALTARRVLEEVLDNLGDGTAVVGHSLGAGLLVDIANDRVLDDMVLFSPAPTPVEHLQSGRLLLFEGQFDPGRIRVFAPRLAASATGTVELNELPWTGHSGALFRPGVIRHVATWLRGEGERVGTLRRISLWLLMFASAIGLGIALLGSSPPVTAPCPPVRTSVVSYILAGILAVAVLAVVNIAGWLRLFATDYLVGFLFLAGALLSARRHTIVFGRGKLAIAVLAAAYLIAIPGLGVASELVQLSLTDGRWWRFAAIAFLGFPLCLADEFLIRPLQPWLKSLGLAILVRLLLAALVSTAVLTVNRPDAFLLVLVPIVVLFWTGLWLAGSAVWRRTRDPLATAVFTALVQGWVFASVFVTT